MYVMKPAKKKKLLLLGIALSAVVVFQLIQFTAPTKTEYGIMKPLGSMEELRSVSETSGDRLLVIYFYADWCGPCRALSPVLEDVAVKMKSSADFFKVNVDKSAEIAHHYNVRGIPYVIMKSNQNVVHTIEGKQRESLYLDAIEKFASGQNSSDPDGEIINGIRYISIENYSEPLRLNVYRGETVVLSFGEKQSVRSVSAPLLGVDSKADMGEVMSLSFTARETGVIPVEIRERAGEEGEKVIPLTVLVSPFRPSVNAFKNVTPAESRMLIDESEDVIILDIRTVQEFRSGHLKNSTHIPLNELQNRIDEIQQYKDQKILVYCRSGNRSIAGSQILLSNGFNQIYHLSTGINGWIRDGFEIGR
ncbi:Thioredoxin [Chitinispirillum alkaliphilum]|nr:Thioredoxin [Chitinispirillum alkaliphilum]